jgi:hypothetical protein
MPDYQTFIALAMEQSLTGGDPNLSPLLDLDMVAVSLVPTVFQDVAMRYAADPDKRNILRRTHTLTLTNGVADLPDEALSAGKAGAVVNDPTDVSVAQNAAMVWYWNDFVAPRSGLLAQIPQWIINDDNGTLNTFHYLEANADYDPSAGFTGNLEIMISSVPVIPATAATNLDVPSEAFSDLVSALASALRNQMKAVA